MGEIIKNVDILVEAIPYIKKYVGQIMVIKYGGNAMIDEIRKENVIKQLVLLRMLGIKVVLVHGGGPDIEEELRVKKIKSHFKNGLRVTDKNTMDIVKQVLIGKTNTEIVNLLNMQFCSAIGISGIDGGIIKCKPSKQNIGYVGEIESINNKLIFDLLEKDYIPVISPIGSDEDGNFYNINADIVASKIAISLKSKKLLLLTNIDGILDKENNKLSVIYKDEVDELINNGTISGGMIPKVKACMMCLENGIERTHIINGFKKNSILDELLTDDGIGTMILEK